MCIHRLNKKMIHILCSLLVLYLSKIGFFFLFLAIFYPKNGTHTLHTVFFKHEFHIKIIVFLVNRIKCFATSVLVLHMKVKYKIQILTILSSK